MTSAERAAAPETAETPQPYFCEHCDDSVPHEHVEEGPLVEGYRRALAGAAAGVGLVVVAGLAIVTLGMRAGAAVPILLGLAAWLVATVIGLVVWTLCRDRTQRVAVIAGAVATAAASPILALVVSAVATGGIAWVGLAGAVGWLLGSAAVSMARSLRLHRVLIADSRPGEAARSGVMRTKGRPSPFVEAAWLVATAVVFGLCVAATTLLPIVVAVLIPLNVALAILSRRAHLHVQAT